MTKTGKIVFWSAIGLVLGAVSIYLMKQFKLLAGSCWAFSGAMVKSLAISKVELTILLKIWNRSAIDILLRSQKYNIYVNNILVSKIANVTPVTLKGKSTQTLSLDVMFNPNDLLKAGWSAITDLITDTSKILITIKGELSLKSGLIAFKTVNIETTMSLKEMTDIYKAPTADACQTFSTPKPKSKSSQSSSVKQTKKT